MSMDARVLAHYRHQYGTRLAKCGPDALTTCRAEAHLRWWAVWLIGGGV